MPAKLDVMDRIVMGERNCWVYTGPVDHGGYGERIRENGTRVSPHRLMLSRFKGEIPAGLQADHLCGNRRCVNPDHLEAVTPRENTLRGATPAARNAAKTHCVNGHPFTEENTYVRPDRVNATRDCRTCLRIRNQKAR